MKTRNVIVLAILFSAFVVPSFANMPVVEGVGRVTDIESPHYMLWFYEVRDLDGALIDTGYGRSPRRLRTGEVSATISKYSELGETLLSLGFDLGNVPVINFQPSKIFDFDKWNESIMTASK